MITRRRNLWMLGGLTMAVAALVVLSAGLETVELQPGHPFSWGRLLEPTPGYGMRAGIGAASLERTFMLAMTAIIWIGLPLVLVYVLASREARWYLLKLVTRWTVITFFIYLVVRSMVTFTGGVNPQLSQAATDTSEQLPALGALPGFVLQPPEWAVALVSLTLATAIAGLAWWIIRRRRATPVVVESVHLAAEAEEALAELRAGGDLHDTVMSCYREMSDVLGRKPGLRRHHSMTPREFEHFLVAAGLRDEHIRRLTRLFEAVRYGGQATGDRDRREAIDCLTAIVRDHGRAA